jgi:hypothetical protein
MLDTYVAKNHFSKPDAVAIPMIIQQELIGFAIFLADPSKIRENIYILLYYDISN